MSRLQPVKTARHLRRKCTPAERLLWSELRNRQLGVKFLRQHPMSFKQQGETHFYVADFCSHEVKLVIEVDGGMHDDQLDYDEHRSSILNHLGYDVIRFTNDEIINDLDQVVDFIRDYLVQNAKQS